MRPSLSRIQNAMLVSIGRKNPESLDPFESFTKGKIISLSEEIERLNAETARLAEEVKAAERGLSEAVGQYLGIAASLEAYYGGKAPKPSPAPEPPVPEPPTESDPEPRS